jgi:predicted lysophospholipase L1 biosynthesis ABC-type transport system permease subunit
MKNKEVEFAQVGIASGAITAIAGLKLSVLVFHTNDLPWFIEMSAYGLLVCGLGALFVSISLYKTAKS